MVGAASGIIPNTRFQKGYTNRKNGKTALINIMQFLYNSANNKGNTDKFFQKPFKTIVNPLQIRKE
jgi:hypothetical protein